jgi:hypothetical protein
MSHRAAALVAGTVALVLAGLANVSESPAPHWPEPSASASELERVRIEHEIVRIPITGEPNLHVPRAAAARKPDRPAAANGRAAAKRADAGAANGQPDAPRSGLFSRTVHTIVGDGRHKPQPFPRPGG